MCVKIVITEPTEHVQLLRRSELAINASLAVVVFG